VCMDTPISPTPAPVVSPTQVLLPTHHIRWKLIGVIFIIALFAGFEAYYFINKSIPEAVIPVFTPRPTSTVPADWKTYWNRQYGFEVKYPGDKFYQQDEERSLIGGVLNEKGVGIFLVDTTMTDAMCESFKTGELVQCAKVGLHFLGINKASVAMIQKLKSIGYNESDFKNKIIAGKTATVFNLGFEGDGATYYFLPTNESATIVIIHDYNKYGTRITSVELFDQILSTFKFTK